MSSELTRVHRLPMTYYTEINEKQLEDERKITALRRSAVRWEHLLGWPMAIASYSRSLQNGVDAALQQFMIYLQLPIHRSQARRRAPSVYNAKEAESYVRDVRGESYPPNRASGCSNPDASLLNHVPSATDARTKGHPVSVGLT